MANEYKLQTVYSRSFPGQHLLDVALVKDPDPKLPFYKPRYFCFISVAPGSKSDNGNRTYDTKSGKINIKIDCEKLMALAHSVRMFARGQDQLAQFSIYADTSKSQYGQGSIKMCWASPWDKQSNDNKPPIRNINISMSANKSTPIGLTLPCCEAIAVADIFEMIAKCGIEEDMKYRMLNMDNSIPQQVNTPTQNTGYSQQPQNTGYSQPQPMPIPTPALTPTNTMNGVVGNFQEAMNIAGPSFPGTVSGMDDVPF